MAFKKILKILLPAILAFILIFHVAAPAFATDDGANGTLGNEAAEQYEDEAAGAADDEQAADEAADSDTDDAQKADDVETEADAEDNEDKGDEEETERETDEDGNPIPKTYEKSEDGWPLPPEIEAEAIYLIEPTTGSILNNQNADKQMYPASTTKILTCLIALQTCSLEETVTFSETAVDLEPGDSNIGAVAGEEMSMHDVLYGLMVASGNECANAIAEHISGSNEEFAKLMNEKAKEIGATNSHFTNPSGLFNREHYTTAQDLALIAQEAYKNSTFVDIISHREYDIPPTNMDDTAKRLTTTVELIRPTSNVYADYVIGGKTGYLLESGRCLVSFAKKDGVSLISVLMNSDYEGVFAESLKNIDYGFDNFNIKNVSQYETRFSYMDENSKVYLDPRAEIMTVSSVPFSDLDASITFVSDMEQDAREAIFEELGMSPDSSLRLYAELKYSYAGHYLGKVYVLIDPSKELAQDGFVQVKYINVVYFVAAAIIVIIILLIASKRSRKKRYR